MAGKLYLKKKNPNLDFSPPPFFLRFRLFVYTTYRTVMCVRVYVHNRSCLYDTPCRRVGGGG
jgi:hypothetical protein